MIDNEIQCINLLRLQLRIFETNIREFKNGSGKHNYQLKASKIYASALDLLITQEANGLSFNLTGLYLITEKFLASIKNYNEYGEHLLIELEDKLEEVHEMIANTEE